MDMGASKLIRLLSRVLVSIKLLTYGHIETIGLIPKISVLFSFLRAISLVLGINRLNFGKITLFDRGIFMKSTNIIFV